jgi:small subunit ribosomal protein S17
MESERQPQDQPQGEPQDQPQGEPQGQPASKPQGAAHRKELVGRVTSAKMEKTVVVSVERTMRHPLFGKVVRRIKKYKAHNADNLAREGDRVKIRESRPLSREKRWVVTEILERAR